MLYFLVAEKQQCTICGVKASQIFKVDSTLPDNVAKFFQPLTKYHTEKDHESKKVFDFHERQRTVTHQAGTKLVSTTTVTCSILIKKSKLIYCLLVLQLKKYRRGREQFVQLHSSAQSTFEATKELENKIALLEKKLRQGIPQRLQMQQANSTLSASSRYYIYPPQKKHYKKVLTSISFYSQSGSSSHPSSIIDPFGNSRVSQSSFFSPDKHSTPMRAQREGFFGPQQPNPQGMVRTPDGFLVPPAPPASSRRPSSSKPRPSGAGLSQSPMSVSSQSSNTVRSDYSRRKNSK